MSNTELERAEIIREKLNQVSPSFCIIKWKHATINLEAATAKSCCHHSFRRIESTGSQQFHDTAEDRAERKQMLAGQRPKNCSYCWKIEDQGHLSNRHFWSSHPWMQSELPLLQKTQPDQALVPSWVELNFSSGCNLKCSYCSPIYSSRWRQEITEHGPYPTLNKHNSLDGLGPITGPDDEKERQAIDSNFWKWFEEVYKDISLLKVTGGEPLISPHTFKLMKLVGQQKNKKLTFAINSNLCPPKNQWSKFISAIQEVYREQSIDQFYLHPSIDTWGDRAEYIRNGLDFNLFKANVEDYLKNTDGHLIFTCTLNNLCFGGLLPLWQYLYELKQKYGAPHRQISLSTEILVGPNWQSIGILPKHFASYIKETLEFVKKHLSEDNSGFSTREYDNLERALSMMDAPIEDRVSAQRNFYRFFNEHDKRRGTDFLKTFPELEEFWNACKSLDAK